jgi:hypothetical protein
LSIDKEIRIHKEIRTSHDQMMDKIRTSHQAIHKEIQANHYQMMDKIRTSHQMIDKEI